MFNISDSIQPMQFLNKNILLALHDLFVNKKKNLFFIRSKELQKLTYVIIVKDWSGHIF